MNNANINISAETLRGMLEDEQKVFVLDVRPGDQRAEWRIPGSYHIDAYKTLNEGDFKALEDAAIPENTKVVTVCAAGKTSLIAANELRKRGIDAYSLEGGMKAWSLAWNSAEITDERLTIIQVRRTGKGCLSYIIGSENEAIVVDASLNPEVYIKIAENKGWTIKYSLDTHVHADHLSRSLALAELTGATLYMPDQDKLKYSFNKIVNGQILEFGASKLEALFSPGHTSESTSYLLNGKYLLTGDTLFTDGVGRPDLKASEDEIYNRAALLYMSLHKIMMLSPETVILPGHISKPVEFDKTIISNTLQEVKEKVPVLKFSEEEFITTILSRIPPTPPNFLMVVELNIAGDLKSVDPKEVEAGANRCAIS